MAATQILFRIFLFIISNFSYKKDFENFLFWVNSFSEKKPSEGLEMVILPHTQYTKFLFVITIFKKKGFEKGDAK